MNARIKRLVILGIISILGVFGIQYYLLSKSYSAEQRTFDHKVQLALYEVVKRAHNYKEEVYPATNPIKRLSGSYYVVNISRDIDCEILEFFLKSELEKAGITTDFEYGIYNCDAGEMVFGNYVSFSNKDIPFSTNQLQTYSDWVYYFGINFPNAHWFIAAGMWLWVIFTVISLTVLIFFVYAIIVVLQQKRFSELQHDVMNNMTHQFKTPLATNKLAIDYLLENNKIKSDDRIFKYCQTIHRQNERLNGYVERILTVSKTDDHVSEFKKEGINISAIINDEINLFKLKSPQTKFHFQEKNHFTILADRFHTTNMIHNLIDNAIQYSPLKAVVNISIQLHPKHTTITIADKGIGIPQKEIKKVFHRFYRVPTGNVHNVKGFGLGLYYVKQVCRLHRWKVKLQSTLHQGTRVQIQIPLKT